MAAPSHTSQTIALLGSTGQTGRVILRHLLAKDTYHLKLYIRSQEKLVKLFPNITSNPHVQLCIGAITDQAVIQECLSNAQIIICALGDNDLTPTSVLRTAAQSIITALKTLKQRNSAWQRPRMINMSSSSRSKRFAAARPKVVHWLIETAFQHGYDDLRAAERILLVEPDLVSVLRVQPGILVEEEGTGYEISTETVRLAASYEDLGAAFVELALERGYDELSEVGVSSKGGDRFARYAPLMLSKISEGFLICYVPGGELIRRMITQAWGLIF